MNDELIAKTPFGDIVVGVKSDPDYPGIFVELRGEHLNDRFKEGAARLAWVEYSSDKQCLQTIVYGDGNADDFTHLIEHEHLQREANLHHEGGETFTAFAYEEDGMTAADLSTYDDMKEAIAFAKLRRWDEVVNDQTGTVVWKRCTNNA